MATVLAALWLSHAPARADGVFAGVFVRTDSDQTVVVSPRVRGTATVAAGTTLNVVYTADVWTSASVDVRASASLPVTEQRDELSAGMTKQFGDLTLSAGYRYSAEHDYRSHGPRAGVALDLAEKSAQLALSLYGFFDDIGKVGDPSFQRELATAGAQLSFTQILDPATIAQLSYEGTHLSGYQSSPYRFVGTRGTGFGCRGATVCLPEHDPAQRTRHAASLQLRRALADTWSAGASYRFYIDDWALLSHTVGAHVSHWLSEHSALTLAYRFYTQGAVSYYQAVYATRSARDVFVTRDREKSPLTDHRVALDWEQRVRVADDAQLVLQLSAAGTRFQYQNFVGLGVVTALDLTVAVTLEL